MSEFVVADAAHGFLRDFAVVDVRLGGDFAGDDDEAGGHQRLAGDAAFGVFGQDGVEDGVGNLVGDLVGMAFGNRFRSKEKLVGHLILLQ
jgi:hypothetical protein